MRAASILLTVLLALPANAQDREADQGAPIVVTGVPLTHSQKQLDDCIKRHCQPKEEIEATLAHAENQFVAGDYAGARRTLSEGHDRNFRYAKTLPVEVADLERAFGRLTDVNGFSDIGRFLQIRSLETLKAGLDNDDARVLAQRLMIGDEFARAGRIRAAEDVYRSVTKKGQKAGEFSIVGYAMLREAMMYVALASILDEYRDSADKRIRALENTRESELAAYRTGARLLRAQLTAYRGDHAELDKAIAAIAPQTSGKPIIVYNPPFRLTEAGGTTMKLSGPQWIDVSFSIAANGAVRGIETLRDSGNVEKGWPQQVYKALAARRYAPQARDGLQRVERFSWVHDEARVTGSRMRQRKVEGRLTSLDLTDDPAPS